jgi:hypothetical protein
MFIALQAQIGAQLFFQGSFDHLLDGAQDDVWHVVGQFIFYIAWQTLTIDHLKIVIQVAAMVKLLGMAHWGIPP